MRNFLTAVLLVSTVLASGCSQTDENPPVVRTVAVKSTLPPEAREPCPANSPKPDRDMPRAEVFDHWAADRTARNVCEARRKAAVAAVDAASPQERQNTK